MTIEENIGQKWLEICSEFSRLYRENFRQGNLTREQASVLFWLEIYGTLPAGSLSELTGASCSTISGILDRLEYAGYVKRTRSADDRRIICSSLTGRYFAEREKSGLSLKDYFGTLFSDTPQEEKETVLDGLEVLAEVLEREK